MSRTVRADQDAVEAEWEFLQRYLEDDWTLVWNTRLRTRNGRCRYVAKGIDLAAYLTTEEAIETLKHEVAHAIVSNLYLRGLARHHGPQWAKICEKVMGIEPRRTMPAKYRPPPEPYRWYYECSECPYQQLFRRRPRRQRLCVGCESRMVLKKVPMGRVELQALIDEWSDPSDMPDSNT